jgi:threonine/homoserine/homoserine lactone efflux protein
VRPLGASQVSPDSHGRLFLTGLAINLGNPKVIVFFLAPLPTVLDLGGLTPLDFTKLALIIAGIASTVLTAYALTAARARRIFTSPRAGRLLNRGSGVAGAAITIATRSHNDDHLAQIDPTRRFEPAAVKVA